MIGETLDGRYQVVRLLGQGGMGTVYEARHTGTGRRVAVKVLAAELLQHPQAIERFQREARAAGAIESQHIAQVLDVGVDPRLGVPFLVMEHLTGEDLDRVEERLRVLPPELVIRIGAQACLGLARAHAAGIVHRDIKPANLFLTERDGGELVVKLLDFGVAKLRPMEATGAAGHKLTRTGSLVGSPLYMSPEQAQGDQTLDARTDLWSLGVTLYQALAGRAPHEDIEAVGKLIIVICTTPAPPLQSAAPWVSPELAAIVDRALRIDPNRRFQSADEMLEALRRLAPEGLSIRSSMLVRETRAPSGQALSMTGSSDSTTLIAGPRRPRGRGLAYGAGAAALAGLGVLGYVATHRAGGVAPAASVTAEALPPAPASPAIAPVVTQQALAPTAASAPPVAPVASSAAPAAPPAKSPPPRASTAPTSKPPQLHDPTTQM